MLSNIFTANRIAAIVTWLTGLAAFITSIIGTFPQSWQNVALGIVGVLTGLVTTLKFLTGSQKWDALTINAVAGSESDYDAPDLTIGESDKNTTYDHGLTPDETVKAPTQ